MARATDLNAGRRTEKTGPHSRVGPIYWAHIKIGWESAKWSRPDTYRAAEDPAQAVLSTKLVSFEPKVTPRRSRPIAVSTTTAISTGTIVTVSAKG